MSKIVTICGSIKFKDKMMDVARDLEIKNKYLVIQCVYGNDILNKEEHVPSVKFFTTLAISSLSPCMRFQSATGSG